MRFLICLCFAAVAAAASAWRIGQRRAHAPDCMAPIASRLEPQDLTAATHWLAAQSSPAGSPAP